MNKKTLQKIFLTLALIVLIAPIMVAADDFGTDKLNDLHLPNQTADPEAIIGNVINLVLGFLALIAVIIILIAGFEWMTAGGNDKRVETAQKRLKYGLIGLIIIFLAYGIVTFVLSTLSDIV